MKKLFKFYVLVRFSKANFNRAINLYDVYYKLGDDEVAKTGDRSKALQWEVSPHEGLNVLRISSRICGSANMLYLYDYLAEIARYCWHGKIKLSYSLEVREENMEILTYSGGGMVFKKDGESAHYDVASWLMEE